MSSLKTAGFYSKIGSAASLIIGIIILAIGVAVNMMALIVFGFLSLFCAVASYVTVTEKIRTEDFEGARKWSIAYGILLLIFGLLIGGIFFLFAHSKLSETPEKWRRPREEEEEQERRKRREIVRERKDKTIDKIELVGHLDFVSGTRRNPQSPFPIDEINVKIGRAPLGKDDKTPNALELNEDDLTLSRDQANIRVDPDTLRVYLSHASPDTGRTTLNAQPVPYGKEIELRDGTEIEFGTNGERWRFRRVGSRAKPTSD